MAGNPDVGKVGKILVNTWLQKVGSNGATLPPKCKGLTPSKNIHLSNLCSSKLTELKYEFWSYWLAPKIFKDFTVELNSISMQPILVPLDSHHVLLTACKTSSGYENGTASPFLSPEPFSHSVPRGK